MFEFEPISIYTCKKFLKELDPRKPLGPSGIPSLGSQRLYQYDCRYAFLDEGRFPSECKRAHVCPIYKKGDTEDPNNYRPISITAIFEEVIREQIVEYLN